jgi:hypothetical protein
MESVTKMFIRARESVVHSIPGQTMTEYAHIIAASPSWRRCLQPMGHDIGSRANGIDSNLTNA